MPPARPGQIVAESIRLQLGTDALVLTTPGPHSCAVVVSSVPGYPARLADAGAELDRESSVRGNGQRIAYTVSEAARALGLSRSMIYDQLRTNRLQSLRIGKRRIITREQIDAWLSGLDSSPPESYSPASARYKSPSSIMGGDV